MSPNSHDSVLTRALSEVLEQKGLTGTPLADLAVEILNVEISGVDDRTASLQRIDALAQTWAQANAGWMNDLEADE